MRSFPDPTPTKRAVFLESSIDIVALLAPVHRAQLALDAISCDVSPLQTLTAEVTVREGQTRPPTAS